MAGHGWSVALQPTSNYAWGFREARFRLSRVSQLVNRARDGVINRARLDGVINRVRFEGGNCEIDGKETSRKDKRRAD